MRADLRALAADDIDAAVAFYRSEASAEVAVEFIDALESAIAHLLRHPLTGSLRFAYELEIPELRSWPLRKFPYLVFYVPDDDRIDIWRILHARRDIPAHLTPDLPD
ncbi:MAG: type II toxin-antitoxin system RelE/ParE family toxin [Acidimicrobiales bacterium]